MTIPILFTLGIIFIISAYAVLLVLNFEIAATLVFFLACTTLPHSFSFKDVSLIEPLVVIIFLFLLFRNGTSSLPIPFLPLVLYIATFSLLIWPDTPESSERIFELFICVMSFAVGRSFHNQLDRKAVAVPIFVLMITTVIFIQLIVTVLQFNGSGIFPSTGNAIDFASGRPAGTHSHPGNLGKVIIVLIALLLPYTKHRTRFVSKIALSGVVISAIPLGLSESRTNFAAYVLMLGTWFILGPNGIALRKKLLVLTGICASVIYFIPTFLERFRTDPTNGLRGHLLDVAYTHISTHFLSGVGPKMYIPHFGQFDVVTAQGWPVHNVFILQLAELGLIGAILMFYPLLVRPFVSASKRMFLEKSHFPDDLALISLIIAIIVIGSTGWSITTGYIGFAVFFSIGFLTSNLLKVPSKSKSVNMERTGVI